MMSDSDWLKVVLDEAQRKLREQRRPDNKPEPQTPSDNQRQADRKAE